jgi:hypothetical protein
MPTARLHPARRVLDHRKAAKELPSSLAEVTIHGRDHDLGNYGDQE